MSGEGRRKLLSRISLALSGGAALLVGVPVLGFIFGPLFRREPGVWRSVGAIDSFRVGDTVEVTFEDASALPWAGITSRTAAWLRRENEREFIAFAVNCTHLGCPVRWLSSAELFMCPCHGGVYYRSGQVAAGPPPQPLNRYPVRLRNGQVEVMASAILIT